MCRGGDRNRGVGGEKRERGRVGTSAHAERTLFSGFFPPGRYAGSPGCVIIIVMIGTSFVFAFASNIACTVFRSRQ